MSKMYQFVKYCTDGYVEGLTNLLLLGACNVETPLGGGKRGIHVACRNGHTQIVELLLAFGANINAKDGNGMTGLHIACQEGHTAVVQQLLDAGCVSEVKDQFGRTELLVACWEGRTEVVQVLLEKVPQAAPGHGACLFPDNYGLSPLPGCNVEARDYSGRTGFHLACRRGYTDLLRLLVQTGCNVEAKDGAGRTGLYIACAKNHIPVVQLLVEEFRCNLDDQITGAQTALHLACAKGYTEVVRMLVEGGCDVDVKDADGKTALSYAGNFTIVQLLVEAGYNVDAHDDFGHKRVLCICLENLRSQWAETEAVLLQYFEPTMVENDVLPFIFPQHCSMSSTRGLPVIGQTTRSTVVDAVTWKSGGGPAYQQRTGPKRAPALAEVPYTPIIVGNSDVESVQVYKKELIVAMARSLGVDPGLVSVVFTQDGANVQVVYFIADPSVSSTLSTKPWRDAYDALLLQIDGFNVLIGYALQIVWTVEGGEEAELAMCEDDLVAVLASVLALDPKLISVYVNQIEGPADVEVRWIVRDTSPHRSTYINSNQFGIDLQTELVNTSSDCAGLLGIRESGC